MRADFRCLADDRYIAVKKARTTRGNAVARELQKPGGRCASPLRVAGREVLPYVSFGQGSQYGIDQCVNGDIRVAMAGQAVAMRNLDST